MDDSDVGGDVECYDTSCSTKSHGSPRTIVIRNPVGSSVDLQEEHPSHDDLIGIGDNIDPKNPTNDSIVDVSLSDGYHRTPLRTLASRKAIGTTQVEAYETTTFSHKNPNYYWGQAPNTLSVVSQDNCYENQTHLYNASQTIFSMRRREGWITLSDILDSFKIDTSTSYDFFWVFCGRTM